MGLKDDEGDVVPAVAAVLSQWVELMVLDDAVDTECLLVRVRVEDVVVPHAGEPGPGVCVGGETVGGREKDVGSEYGRGSHEKRLSAAEEDEERGHPGERAARGGRGPHRVLVMPDDAAPA